MEKLLFIDACVRAESRTRALAEHWLAGWQGEAETVKLDAERPAPLTREALAERTALCAAGKLDAPQLRYARQFSQADALLFAAPYWDLSFPAVLKAYLEAISVNGITFEYTPQGMPQSLCRAKRLIYVTTAGGPILSHEPGFGYVRLLGQTFWGVQKADCYSAQLLDIAGSDPQAILNEAMREMDRQEAHAAI